MRAAWVLIYIRCQAYSAHALDSVVFMARRKMCGSPACTFHQEITVPGGWRHGKIKISSLSIWCASRVGFPPLRPFPFAS